MHCVPSPAIASALAVILLVACTANTPATAPPPAGAHARGVPPPPVTASNKTPAAASPAPPRASHHATSSLPRDGDAGTLHDASAAPSNPTEHWAPDLHSDDSCVSYHDSPYATHYDDPHGKKRLYGYDGYVFRRVQVRRTIDGKPRLHCARVYYPSGYRSHQGKTVRVRDRIDDAWYRLIENTLDRIPWRHLQQVRAFVIDNRPLLHGVASFDRRAPAKDARDGHTIWLNERLFTRVNHWAHGNYGYYWAYHVQRDNERVDGQSADHDLFSPVLLHEIGHIVNYNVINGHSWDPTCPPCAHMCGDLNTCKKLTEKQKEAPCATAYCTGFGFSSGTENWAEMYRWFYQGSATRSMLREKFPSCYQVFDDGVGGGVNAGLATPWDRGLGEIVGYHATRWDSAKRGERKK